MFWIEPGNVHVNPQVAFPLTVTGLRGRDSPTHHFSGAASRTDGRRSKHKAARPLPRQLCMNPHDADEECY
jgi:hypothetical protein